jgi:ADP-ribose pyrophosphatase YjhB (NUDIX family)
MSPVELFHDDGSVPYRFCPRCGGGLQPRVVFAHDPPRLVCSACGFVFYLDPKVAAGAICRMDGGIVLARRGIEPGYGLWVYPGGYVDRGESLEEAAVREAREEVGLEIRLTGLVNAYSYPGRPVIVVVFAAEVIGGSLTRGGLETLDAQVFPDAAIPWGELAFRSTTDALREYLAGRVGPVAARID